MPHKDSSRHEVAQVCALLLLVCLSYGNSILNGFVNDDFQQIIENPYVHSFRFLRAIFTTSMWSFQGVEGILSYYRPAMTFGYLLCWKFFGSSPLGFHFVNIVLHAAVVLLVFFTARRLFQDSTSPFLAAMLFAIHPIHTESVAEVASSGDLEMAVFYLLAFWLFLDLSKTGRPRLWIRYALMCASFALAALSKEPGVTLPVVAMIYEHFYRQDRHETSLKQKISRYAGLWAVLCAYLVARVHVLGAVTGTAKRSNVSYYEALLSAVALTGKYVGKLLWPVHLALFYNFHKSTSVLQPAVLLGLLALAGVAVAFVWTGMQSPASFCVVWFLVTLAPVLNIRLIVTYAFAERYLYLPSVGFCWLAGYGIGKLWSRLADRPAVWRGALACGLAAVGIFCVVKVIRQNPTWLSQDTLIRQTLAQSTDASFFHANLGAIYWNKGDLAAAEREWRDASATDPNDYILLEDLGLLSAKQGHMREAYDYFQRVEREHPTYTHIYLTFGSFYEQTGQMADAEGEYRTGVRLAPLNVQLHNRLGTLLLSEGRLPEAQQEFSRSVDIDPTGAACDALGDIYSKWKDDTRAAQAFAQAASLEPFDSHAHFGLAALYAAQGSSSAAKREYELGLRTDPSNPAALAMLQQLKP